jgi:hypothetical protein
MSNKRNPLLSDEDIDNVLTSVMPDIDYGFGGEGQWMEQGAIILRAEYERLIDEGKLRVVEEVDPVEKSNFYSYGCPNCSWTWKYMGEPIKYNYCPGCGNKIKR